MKTIFPFLPFLCCITIAAYSQNTFPSSGNVGIGTTNPSEKLDVNGNIKLLSAENRGIIFQRYDDKPPSSIMGLPGEFTTRQGITINVSQLENALNITSGGNIGINEIAPAEKLVVRESRSLSDINSNSVVDMLKLNLSIWDGFVPANAENRLVFNHQQWGSGGASLTYSAIGSAKEVDGEGLYGGGRLVFYTRAGDPGTQTGPGLVERMRINREGNIGVGTSSPDAKLTVKGDIHAEEVRVDLNVPGPDYVFEEDYDLPTLKDIETYVRENKHLPEVPSAQEMEESGIDLGVMNVLLLKKIEEMTLHLIQQNKLNAVQSEKIALQNKIITKLQSQVESINTKLK